MWPKSQCIRLLPTLYFHFLIASSFPREVRWQQMVLRNMSRIVSALFAVMTNSPSGGMAFYMIDEIGALLFRRNKPTNELKRLLRDGGDAPTQIRDAFCQWMEMAGKNGRIFPRQFGVKYLWPQR
jgi:hypothetical protein